MNPDKHDTKHERCSANQLMALSRLLREHVLHLLYGLAGALRRIFTFWEFSDRGDQTESKSGLTVGLHQVQKQNPEQTPPFICTALSLRTFFKMFFAPWWAKINARKKTGHTKTNDLFLKHSNMTCATLA